MAHVDRLNSISNVKHENVLIQNSTDNVRLSAGNTSSLRYGVFTVIASEGQARLFIHAGKPDLVRYLGFHAGDQIIGECILPFSVFGIFGGYFHGVEPDAQVFCRVC